MSLAVVMSEVRLDFELWKGNFVGAILLASVVCDTGHFEG